MLDPYELLSAAAERAGVNIHIPDPAEAIPATEVPWRMPLESDPHEQTWMAWPTSNLTLGRNENERDETRQAWTSVANTVSEFEHVSILIAEADLKHARKLLSGAITLIPAALNDGWMRDIGPVFVLSPDQTLGAVDWTFNGWGEKTWARWGYDSLIAKKIAEVTSAERIESRMVAEGGSIATDGLGTAIVTQPVFLDRKRNPGRTRANIEKELARTLGIEHTIWLPSGLTHDASATTPHAGLYGRGGQVGDLVAYPRPGMVLVHDQTDPSHPDYAISRSTKTRLAGERDARGLPLEIVPVPAPQTLRNPQGFVGHTYIQHYPVNGGIIVGTFRDPNDDKAVGVLRDIYGDREVVALDARALCARGGGIHSITLNQPSSTGQIQLFSDAPGREAEG